MVETDMKRSSQDEVEGESKRMAQSCEKEKQNLYVV
jgi:hypothetical protein